MYLCGGDSIFKQAETNGAQKLRVERWKGDGGFFLLFSKKKEEENEAGPPAGPAHGRRKGPTNCVPFVDNETILSSVMVVCGARWCSYGVSSIRSILANFFLFVCFL